MIEDIQSKLQKFACETPLLENTTKSDTIYCVELPEKNLIKVKNKHYAVLENPEANYKDPVILIYKDGLYRPLIHKNTNFGSKSNDIKLKIERYWDVINPNKKARSRIQMFIKFLFMILLLSGILMLLNDVSMNYIDRLSGTCQ